MSQLTSWPVEVDDLQDSLTSCSDVLVIQQERATAVPGAFSTEAGQEGHDR